MAKACVGALKEDLSNHSLKLLAMLIAVSLTSKTMLIYQST